MVKKVKSPDAPTPLEKATAAVPMTDNIVLTDDKINSIIGFIDTPIFWFF